MKEVKVIIIGSGFGGLCMGIKLKQAGINDFLILEKETSLGGTWRDNIYPGAECDIPSALYSYSFEHNKDWEFKWSGQAQILKYQQDTASKYELHDHLRFEQEVCHAQFLDNQWVIKTKQGEEYQAQHFITALGQLHHPFIPEFDNDSDYQGKVFHSAQWQNSIQLKDKSVAVIGNAASAVQLIPEIADEVKTLTIYQRSPNWILPKLDKAYSKAEKDMSVKWPLITKMYRFSIWVSGEWVVFPAIKGNPVARWLVRTLCKLNLFRFIRDKKLRKELTPNYALGAKRILFSDTYYPSLTKDNVVINQSGIKQFDSNGIIDKNNQHADHDVVIYATGFITNPFLSSINVEGVNGRILSEHWSNGAHAYLGITTHHFPNMHMMYGPNTNLGHTSIIIMLEAQAKYIVECITSMDEKSWKTIEVKEDVENKFNDKIQQRLSKLAFSKIADSWYMQNGKITNNWPGGTREYMKRVKKVNWSDFAVSR